MKSYQIIRYLPPHKTVWDVFVVNNSNATFLFYRDFIEYHQDRFEDFSLMIFDGEKLVGIIPGHRVDKRFCSHRGLTYAGLILHPKLGVSDVESIFNQLTNHLKDNGFDELEVKITPAFYQEKYSSAIEYFLFQKGAKLLRRDLNFVIDLQKPITLSKNKTQIVKKGIPQHLTIEMTENFAPFWNTVLTPALAKSYDARPIHSIDEIALLANRFPANILQYQLLHDGECIAGITLFCNMKIIKTQYAATNEKGKKINALDYLYLYLTEKLKKEGYHYFDLGHTNIEDGYKYNTTLSRYKERIGGSPVNADCYLLSL